MMQGAGAGLDLDQPVPLAIAADRPHIPGMRGRRTVPILLLAGLTLAPAGLTSAWAQETIDQFNAANAENRRHTAAEIELRNNALQVRQDQARDVLNCRGVATCQNNLQLQTQQRGLMLNNQIRQERDTHRSNLQGIGVPPLQ